MKEKFFSNRTNLIFLHKLIKAFADSLIKAFVPLIILKSSGSLQFVALYLVTYYFSTGILNLILKKFLQKYGIFAILLHIIPMVSLQFLLTLNFTWWFCILIGFIASFSLVLYSVPFNLLFALSDKNVDVAKFQIATNFGKLIFILFSGYVLTFNFKNSIILLAIIGAILYILSSVPILFGYNLLKESYVLNANKTVSLKHCDYKFFNLYHICFGIFQSVVEYVIPIYLYVNYLTFETVAIIMALIEALKILSNIIAKKLVNSGHSTVSIILSVVCFSIGCVVFLFVKIPVVLYICSSLISISFPLVFVPIFKLYCKDINKNNYTFDGMIYRDCFICVGFVLMWAISYISDANFYLLFSVGILSIIGILITSIRLLHQKNKE